MISRRQAIKAAILTTAGFVSTHPISEIFAVSNLSRIQKETEGPFQLPSLSYSFDALEPHIDAQTMEVHYSKHHAGYVKNLNQAVMEDPRLQKKSVEDLLRNLDTIPLSIRDAVRNNGGGHINHSLFWQTMSQQGGGQPEGDLAKAIDQKFGSFTKFQDEFTKTATRVFGSGWAWLSLTPKRELIIESTPNQDSPILKGHVPLMGLDVWEHAYYLKYQNRRAEYIAAFYHVIHWKLIDERYRTSLA